MKKKILILSKNIIKIQKMKIISERKCKMNGTAGDKTKVKKKCLILVIDSQHDNF